MTIYSLDHSFPYLEPVCCSMSSSNCCFLTCIRISQEAGKVVWYSHFLKNFPQFVVTHATKAFGLVNKTEIAVFLEFPCFSMTQQMLTIWSFVPLPFLNPVWTSASSQFMYLKPGLENCEHYFAIVWDEYNCEVVWTFLALPFFGIGMKTDLFQSCGHCWVFQICWYIECSTFTASSFQIWNSSAGIPSHPLALFIVMIPKAHLTSHSRCLALGEWSHHRGYLSHEDLFLYNSSVYSCHLFLSLYKGKPVIYL